MKKISLTTAKNLLLVKVIAAQTHAFAQVTATQGLTTAKTTLEAISSSFVQMVAVFVLIYLVYMGVMALTERKTWAQFGWAVVYVAFVGGAVNLATWAYSLFR